MSQDKKTINKAVMSPRPMTAGEIKYKLKEIGLTIEDLVLRTGMSQPNVSGTISGRVNSPTVLGYLEDLGINHNRPYDRNQMLRPYNPEEAA